MKKKSYTFGMDAIQICTKINNDSHIILQQGDLTERAKHSDLFT